MGLGGCGVQLTETLLVEKTHETEMNLAYDTQRAGYVFIPWPVSRVCIKG